MDLEELSKLNDRDLLNLCKNNTDVNEVCKKENFWEERALKNFGKESGKYRPVDLSWRNFYLQIIFDLDISDLKNNPWNFVNELTWNIRDSPKEKNINYGNMTRQEINRFNFLNMGSDIIFLFPLGKYSSLLYEKTLKKNRITPKKVFRFVYDFYQKSMKEEDIKEFLEDDPFGIENYEDEDEIFRMVVLKNRMENIVLKCLILINFLKLFQGQILKNQNLVLIKNCFLFF
jgi:hypothetical protein